MLPWASRATALNAQFQRDLNRIDELPGTGQSAALYRLPDNAYSASDMPPSTNSPYVGFCENRGQMNIFAAA